MPKAPLRADIAAARATLPWYSWRSFREVNRLNRYLHANEQVVAVAAATYAQGGGLIVITPQRLLFFKDGWFRKVSEDFAWEHITSVEFNSRIFKGELTIMAAGSEPVQTEVWAHSGNRMAQMIRERVGGRATHGGPATDVSGGSAMLASIERLDTLRRNGAIDDAEYAELKRQVIQGN